jgi:uncharacterized protein (DUF433 family)
MSTITYPHIETNSEGVAVLSGTSTKVVEIVQGHLAHHWQADEIQRQYPYLVMAQIHAALTYYYDHQEVMNQEIEFRLRRSDAIKLRRDDGKIREKLRKLGHLP